MSVDANNKRVAKNTLFLYFRMIVIILVNLYTTRIVLEQLGETDYGIYNVVGGVVMMLSFINGSLATTTQRYMTFELGRGDYPRLAKVFSASLNIHFVIALLIILLAETVGLWFLNTYMNIPAESAAAANWVYQLSILTFCVNVIQAPFNAAIIAHEDMKIFAYISLLEAALKLGIAFALVALASGKLIWYAVMVFVAQLIVRVIYQVFCKRRYSECAFRWVRDMSLYKEMTSFTGWNLLSGFVWLLKGQGLNILFNIFFGPVINAAQAVANQVRQAIMGFIYNFMSAVSPQITKYYAAGDYREMEALTHNGLRYSFILLFIMSLPVMLSPGFILGLWLEEVPYYASVFTVLVLIDSLSNALFDQPLMTSIAATGIIRAYQIVVSSVMFLIVPLGYVVLRCGYSPAVVYYVSITITVIAGVIRYYYCRKLIGYSWGRFWRKVLKPTAKFVAVALPAPLLLRLFVLPDDTLIGFLSVSAASLICSLLSAWYVGVDVSERVVLYDFIKSKIRR